MDNFQVCRYATLRGSVEDNTAYLAISKPYNQDPAGSLHVHKLVFKLFICGSTISRKDFPTFPAHTSLQDDRHSMPKPASTHLSNDLFQTTNTLPPFPIMLL